MKPLQKKAAIIAHKNAGQIVGASLLLRTLTMPGMCGDGANDCAALSSAHFGVALSEAEASLVSPFSAKSLSTMSTVELVKEGRACLANAFSGFKFTIFYGAVQVGYEARQKN